MSARLHSGGLRPSGLLPVPATELRKEKEAYVDLGWPGLDPFRPSLDVVDFDHSGSVTAVGGNDPIGNRFREASRAVEVVAAWCTTKRSKIAVIHFDQPSPGDSGVIALARGSALIRVKAALRVPWNAAGTSDLGPSLRRAEALAAEYSDHDVRLTIFSDFEITDADPADVFARLARFPGHVHAVALKAEPPVDLRGENITITRLVHGDPPGALAASLHRSLTATRRGRRLSVIHANRTQPSIPPLSPGSAPEMGALR